MDIFRFHNNPATPLKMEQGEIIVGMKSKMWVERYRDAGEFEIVADVSSGIRDKLPIGSFISHVDTDEIMVVETHSISEDRGKPSDITISGRGFETILDRRVVGENRYFPNVGTLVDYTLTADYTWNQALHLIKDHIDETMVLDAYDALPYVSTFSTVDGSGSSLDRSVQMGDLYSRVIELLQVDRLGIRVIRPGKPSPLSAGSPNIALVIHKGVDRTADVMFSNDSGEIESADYLWSNKLLKNSALVRGRWVELRVDNLIDVNDQRRTMFVDAKDVDEQFEAEPTGTDLLNIEVKMEQRGRDAIAQQRSISLTKTEITKDGTEAKYRVDFNVGDIVSVHGDYHENSRRRVSEYVEIEDENGSKSYPTLNDSEAE